MAFTRCANFTNSVLRQRRTQTHNAYLSLEYRNVSLHGMDRSWMSQLFHQLDRMEREYGQLGTRLV